MTTGTPFKHAKKFHKRPPKLGKTNDFEKYLSLSCEESSHLNRINHVVHVCLLPEYFDKKKEAIDILLTEELGPYSTQLHGFPIAFEPNAIKFNENMGKVIGIQPVVHFDVSTNFIVFQPVVDAVFEGVVNKMSEYMVGCLIHGRFYAAIHKSEDCSDNEWISMLEYGDKISLKVTKIEENQSGYVSIIGSLIEKLESANVWKQSETIGEDSGVGLDEESPTISKKIVFENSESEESIKEHKKAKKHKKKSKKRKLEEEVFETNIPCKIIKEEPVDEYIFNQVRQQSVQETTLSPKKHKKSKKKKVKIKEEVIENDQVFTQQINIGNTHNNVETPLPFMHVNNAALDNTNTIFQPPPYSTINHDQNGKIMSNDSNIIEKSRKHKKKKKEKKVKIKQEIE